MKCFWSFLCAMVAMAGALLGASEFWNSRKPADWSSREIREFLTKSPWVRYWGEIGRAHV